MTEARSKNSPIQIRRFAARGRLSSGFGGFIFFWLQATSRLTDISKTDKRYAI
jgi:hypothetical protein